MTKIKKLGIVSLGCFAALAALLIILVNMAANALIQYIVGAFPAALTVLYWNAALSQAVITVLIAFITWMIIALIYNLIAKSKCGLNVEIADNKKK